jgi:serine/threonine-protein phosphatase 2A activator
MPNFRKIHKGLLKMYQEEVLGKRVVVQHLFLDEYTWGPDIKSGTGQLAEDRGASAVLPGNGNGMEATKAPWAR